VLASSLVAPGGSKLVKPPLLDTVKLWFDRLWAGDLEALRAVRQNDVPARRYRHVAVQGYVAGGQRAGDGGVRGNLHLGVEEAAHPALIVVAGDAGRLGIVTDAPDAGEGVAFADHAGLRTTLAVNSLERIALAMHPSAGFRKPVHAVSTDGIVALDCWDGGGPSCQSCCRANRYTSR
jgi:hypothetical protein